MTGTYPGVIPYRSSSPSSPQLDDTRVPELLYMNKNFSLRKKQMGLSMTSLNRINAHAGDKTSNLRTSLVERERSRLRELDEDDLRNKYFGYWAGQQQQVRKYCDLKK